MLSELKLLDSVVVTTGRRSPISTFAFSRFRTRIRGLASVFVLPMLCSQSMPIVPSRTITSLLFR